MRAKLNTYQRIKRAAINGTSLRLTREQVWELYFADSAIKQVADTSDGWRGYAGSHNGTYEEQAAKATEGATRAGEQP